MEIGQAVAVVGEELGLAFDVWTNGSKPFADGGRQARVDERDGPVVDVTVQQPQLAAAAGEDEVVGERTRCS